jgi:lipopolysaccharide/colanic/teichoic acid biosynthesis glycosyltransferase
MVTSFRQLLEVRRRGQGGTVCLSHAEPAVAVHAPVSRNGVREARSGTSDTSTLPGLHTVSTGHRRVVEHGDLHDAGAERGAGLLAGVLEAAAASAPPGAMFVLQDPCGRCAVLGSSALLGAGHPVAIQCDHYPSLAAALGEWIDGQRSVVLLPRGGTVAGRAINRVRDVTLAAGALLLLSPIFFAVGCLIKLSSPGPIVYSAEVVGLRGRRFTWHKLRSMHVAAPEEETERHRAYAAAIEGKPEVAPKLLNEDRVFGVGRFIRRHSIDELPQLWSVLTGKMSLVGPRPCAPYEYQAQYPWQRLRYRVKPGLTGVWQAYGRLKVSFEEWFLMDYCYGWKASPALDVRIIARTIQVVLSGEGGK